MKKTLPFIDLRSQYLDIKSEIKKRINDVLEHGQYIMGPEIVELEEKLASYVGVKHCISASSGTDTLLIAMLALDIGRGDEVITTPFTYFATAEMIALVGATPVFVDVDKETYNIDPQKIERAISKKTKAIMPVSLFGQCADMDPINELASLHGIAVIEDGAQSFGSTYKNKKSCGLSTIGSTSFFPSKPLGTYGDGGALFTDDDILASKMREIRVHGQDKRNHHKRIGINGRMDTIQAAILLAKLERFKWEIIERQKIASSYDTLIAKKCSGIICPKIAKYNDSVFAQYTIKCIHRDKIAEALKKKGIPTAIYYPILISNQRAFKYLATPKNKLKNAEALAETVLSLPMSPELTYKQQELIVNTIAKEV